MLRRASQAQPGRLANPVALSIGPAMAEGLGEPLTTVDEMHWRRENTATIPHI